MTGTITTSNSSNIVSQQSEDISTPHVVIIEDNEAILQMICDALRDEGYRVTGMNALNAIEELVDFRADCFILDEHLPVVSGHIICIMLKFNSATRRIPIILMSGYNELEYVAGLCESDGYLKKPFDLRTLTDTVKCVLQRTPPAIMSIV